MADDINHNTPEVNNDFNQVKETQDIDREPVSKIELDRLNAEREAQKLEYDLHYTIGGNIEQEVHTDLNQEREARINYIEERLDSYQDKARNDFNKTEQKQKEIEREPVSKVEQDDLKAEREIPKPEIDFTISGSLEQEVITQVIQDRDARIDHIEERLGSYQNKARDDFNMTQQTQDENEMKKDQGRSR